MEIRPATQNDLDALLEMNAAFNGAHCTERSSMARALENPRELVLLAFVEGQAAGFCCCQRLSSVCYRDDFVQVEELYIRGEFRRRGVGRALLAFAENLYARDGIRYFHLCTGLDNTGAQALYEAFGFGRSGYRYTKVLPEHHTTGERA